MKKHSYSNIIIITNKKPLAFCFNPIIMLMPSELKTFSQIELRLDVFL